MAWRPNVCVDFDGVIHSYERGWQGGRIYGEIDVAGIRQLHSDGYAVTILTARPLEQLEAPLRTAGFPVLIDFPMGRSQWNGGGDGTTVLVTNRKVAAVAYIDDRAVRHQYGDDWAATVSSVDVLAARHDGFATEEARR